MDEIIKNTTYPRRWSFREFDFFSGGTGIKIKGDERVKSFLGAFITVVIYILLGLSTGYYILQFLDETSPKIQYNRRQLPMPSEFRFPDSGMNFFFLVTNPSPKAGTTDEFYLTVDTLKKYYTATSIYQESNYTIDGTVTIKTEIKRVNITLVPCNQTTWFNDPTNQEILKQNLFTMFIIQNFGICPNMTSEVVIFGDDQTSNNGRYRFRLEICSPQYCDPDYLDTLKNSGEQSLVIGAFEPSVNSSDKATPWKSAVNLDNLVPIGMFLNTRATMSLKEVDIETDTGILISKTSTLTKSGINNIRRDYTPVVSLGEPIGGSADLYSVRSLRRQPPIFEFRLISSRTSEGYSRSYITVLDLFGNIGGSIEFMIVVFLIFFNWIEIRYSDSRARSVTARSLGLPKLIKPGMHMFGYSEKDQKNELLAEASEVIDELTDSTISLEQMSLDRVLVRFYLDHSIPEDIRLLVPTVSIMKDIVEKKKEQMMSADYIDNYVKKKYKGIKDQLKARRKSAAIARTHMYHAESSAAFSLPAATAPVPPALRAQTTGAISKNKYLDPPTEKKQILESDRKHYQDRSSIVDLNQEDKSDELACKITRNLFRAEPPIERVPEGIDLSTEKKSQRGQIQVPKSGMLPKLILEPETPRKGPEEAFKANTTSDKSSDQVVSLEKQKDSDELNQGLGIKDTAEGIINLDIRPGELPYTSYIGVDSNGSIEIPSVLEPGSLLEAYYSVLANVRDSQVCEQQYGTGNLHGDEFRRMRHHILLTIKQFADVIQLRNPQLIFEEDNHTAEKVTRGFTWVKTTHKRPPLSLDISKFLLNLPQEEQQLPDPSQPEAENSDPAPEIVQQVAPSVELSTPIQKPAGTTQTTSILRPSTFDRVRQPTKAVL